jgi:hypothetical protein
MPLPEPTAAGPTLGVQPVRQSLVVAAGRPSAGSMSLLRSRDVGPDDLAALRKRARPELRPQLLEHR